jgi:hypothetical protein
MHALDPWYVDNLVCPVDGTRLKLDDNTLSSVNGRQYSYSVLQHFSTKDARKALGQVGCVLRRDGVAKIQMANWLGVRNLQHQAMRPFREPTAFEVRYWSLGQLRNAFEEFIDPTKITIDCYFGLGGQWADLSCMLDRHKPILTASEGLKRLSSRLPLMCCLADSVHCTATGIGVPVERH